MRFENLKEDFPAMPKEIRDMIEAEVERKVKQPGRRKMTAGRLAAVSLAAVMLCGATVFAGAGIYRMQQEKLGEHGVSVNITGSGNTEGDAAEEQVTIPNVKLELGYLPEGMVRTARGKYGFENAPYEGGVTMTFYRMDTGDDRFEVQHGDVLSSEEFAAGEHQGVYLEYPKLDEEEIAFNQRIYVAFTDVHYVMEMYAASDVSKEEALKIAENVKLIPTEDTGDVDLVLAGDWSGRQSGFGKLSEGEGYKTITSAAAEDVEVHEIGDSFPMNVNGLTAKVADVKIADDISLLDSALLDEELKGEADGSGKLRPATIRYVKKGDMDALSQEVSSRQAPQKLIYASVEYTNTGEEELMNVLFFGELPRIRETGGQMQITGEETPQAGDKWDMAVNYGLSDSREMVYYDVHGGEKGNNYIESIRPGETVTVHMAWIVLEEEMGELYLCLDPSGSGYEFSESSLEIGYVKIQ